MQQLGFEGMPRRLYPCTPSRLRSWLDCPRRYRMTYLDRPSPPKGPPWAHNSLGASVHNALAGWWRLKRAQRTPEAAARLLADGWINEGFSDDAQSAEYLRRSQTMVEEYVAKLDPACEPAGIERTVAAKTDLIAMSGRIDRLDDRPANLSGVSAAIVSAAGISAAGTGAAGTGAPGSADEPDPFGRELVVVDYKTGRSRLSTDDARSSLALGLYALAAGRVLRRPCRAVELHHLPSGQVLRWEHSPGSLERHLRRAEDIAAECVAADQRYKSDPDAGRVDEVFPPAPGPACGWCDFRSHCPEGIAATAPRRPWDGLDDNPMLSLNGPRGDAAAASD
ncbi:MAG: PD-(D/E)XK nuclease family protein [Nocardiopsaceae bacterium]|nr:PD-(D/E)XK nuclease family protein [Nocardiopsaceae bacterium]